MTAPHKRIETYAEFWPYYLKEHARSGTRQFHVAGTLISIIIAIFLIADRKPVALLACPLIGYAFAWYSHFFIEKNRPATFKYPLWSFISDFKMAYLFLIGKL